jgi:hypothetical protein
LPLILIILSKHFVFFEEENQMADDKLKLEDLLGDVKQEEEDERIECSNNFRCGH